MTDERVSTPQSALGKPLSSADLIAVAAAAGHEVSPRSLQLWRRKGLLPRPARHRGGRSVWLHPAGTDAQLLRLLHWRERSRDHGLILIGLWSDGFAVEPDKVRAALTRSAGRTAENIGRIPRESPEPEGELIDRLAGEMARKRSGAPIPRLARMTVAERERAYGYLLAGMFRSEPELARRTTDVGDLERLVGMRSGHGGGLAGEAQLVDLRDQSIPPSAQAVRAAIGGCSEQELELARRIVVVWTKVIFLLLPALFPGKQTQSRDLIRLLNHFLEDPDPGALAFFAAVAVFGLTSKRLSEQQLCGLLTDLSSDSLKAELARLLSQDESGAPADTKS